MADKQLAEPIDARETNNHGDHILTVKSRLRQSVQLSSLMCVSYFSPKIVRTVLEGRQPVELSTTRLLRAANKLPLQWDKQGKQQGFDARN